MRSPHVMKALEVLVSVMGEKQRLDAKELKAVVSLNRALKGTGYRLGIRETGEGMVGGQAVHADRATRMRN